MRIFLTLFIVFYHLSSFSQAWKPINGSKDTRNHYTAFTNATIFVKSGEILENATLLIQKDKIIAVGAEVSIPENAVVINLEGKFIYPSFIDLHTQYGQKKIKEHNHFSGPPQLESKKRGPYYWNESIKPEVNAVDLIKHNAKEAKKYRTMGFGTLLTHQMDGLIRGTSALVTLNDKQSRVLSPRAAMHYSFLKGSSKQTYPSSLMGMIALIRQTHMDMNWYRKMGKEIPFNASLDALVQADSLPKIIDATSTLSMLRADKIGDEFDFQFILKGNGNSYERAKDIKATGAAVIATINYPKPYEINELYEARKLPLSAMKRWEMANKNLSILDRHDVQFAISAFELANQKDFFSNMTAAIDNGLDRSKAIKALTETPAQLIGATTQLGTLSPNKLANFIVTSDSLFSENCKLYSNWVLGKPYVISAIPTIDLAGQYSLNINKTLQFDVKVVEKKEKFTASVAPKNDSNFVPAKLSVENNRINLSYTLNNEFYQLSGSTNDSKSRIWTGKTVIKGKWSDWAAIKKNSQKVQPVVKKDSSLPPFTEEQASVFYPNMAFGWDSLPNKAEAIVFRNATVWTNEKEGVLKNHDVVIFDGQIQMVGYKINLEVMFPERFTQLKEIDASGKHLTCGIIDEHSHIAIDEGVNESGQAVTAEVSIGDVVSSNDINIYRQLAGGVTASQLLHGSANPIGGQSALIKLRWGQTPEKMKIKDADGFIKFALGENVKQSNWGDFRTVRFPQTRMGVEQVFYDAFHRAKEYQAEWQLYSVKKPKEKKKTIPPRRDLELEALSEILDTNRFITCHSYIQSEINMLMHVADSMGFTINTFTHILEGYKVADKLKKHGAAASTFSDWWAYKFEVNDAIPYNGAMLNSQGILTGFNSDDAEMGRRLNQEAAKAVKYGGVSEEEAWKFVTLNPAKMLHLDHRMGSIKVGKDADLVVWSAHPLSVYAKPEQTYIDGIAYFDAQRDQAWRARIVKERARIIAKMLNAKKEGQATQKIKKQTKKLYECDTIEQ